MVAQCSINVFRWIIIAVLVLMNPSLGVMLIGAVQHYLDCVLDDMNWSTAAFKKPTISCSIVLV